MCYVWRNGFEKALAIPGFRSRVYVPARKKVWETSSGSSRGLQLLPAHLDVHQLNQDQVV